MRLLVATLALLVYGSASACSCIDPDVKLRIFVEEGFREHAVFHARVVTWNNANDVELQVLEVFRGDPGVRTRLTGRDGMCGGGVAPNEEFVYLQNAEPSIGLCSKLEPSAMNLHRLRQVAQAKSFPIATPPEALAQVCARIAAHGRDLQAWLSQIRGMPNGKRYAEIEEAQHERHKKRMGC
jgi:hypothetical protein